MSFDDRLRGRRADRGPVAEREGAFGAAQAFRAAREQGRRRGRDLLPKVWQTVAALRADRERSEAYLMPDGTPRRAETGTGVAAVARTVSVKDRTPWYRRRTYTARQELVGWQIASPTSGSGGFIFQIPVAGDPTVRQSGGGIPMSLLGFVEGGAYEPGGPSGEPSYTRADAELEDMMRVVEAHLALLDHRGAREAQ